MHVSNVSRINVSKIKISPVSSYKHNPFQIYCQVYIKIYIATFLHKAGSYSTLTFKHFNITLTNLLKK